MAATSIAMLRKLVSKHDRLTRSPKTLHLFMDNILPLMQKYLNLLLPFWLKVLISKLDDLRSERISLYSEGLLKFLQSFHYYLMWFNALATACLKWPRSVDYLGIFWGIVEVLQRYMLLQKGGWINKANNIIRDLVEKFIPYPSIKI
jgi:hypothetical protein